MKSEIVKFLRRNGFEKMEKNSYANNMCNVVFRNGCEVADNAGNVTYGTENLYWIVGVLVFKGYISKGFKK